jgi:hypothetical protein
MADNEFKGETRANIENIKEDVSEIKDTIVRLDEKLDHVSRAADKAAVMAQAAVVKTNQVEIKQDERHKENTEKLEAIGKNVSAIANAQVDTKVTVAKISVYVTLLGGAAGILIPKLIDLAISMWPRG